MDRKPWTPAGLGSSIADSSLEEIKQSIFSRFSLGSYREARKIRHFHRHYTAKARLRKKQARKRARASRKYNYKHQKVGRKR
jgi:hypothetical protein